MSQPLYEHRGVQYAQHGTDFWFCLPRTAFGMNANHACMYIMSEHNCTVTIRNELLDYTYTKFITSCHEVNSRLDTLNFIELPDNIIHFNDELYQSMAAQPQPRGFHVTSTDTICVYLFSYSMGNIDVTSLLPTDMLRDEYVVQTYPEYPTAQGIVSERGMFQVVATEDSTVVDITLGDIDWLGRERDSVVTVTLNRGMMYNVRGAGWCDKYSSCCQGDIVFPGFVIYDSLEPHMFSIPDSSQPLFEYPIRKSDLSGTYVKARNNKRIAVFQGNQSGVVGGYGTADLMFEQAMPLRFAGTEFLVPNVVASVFDHIQFTGLVDGTTVTIMNTSDPLLPTRTLNVDARTSDWFLQEEGDGPFYITSTHPILVTLSPCGALFRTPYRGDPATLAVIPVEWWHNGPANASQVYYLDNNNNGWVYFHSTHIFTRTADVPGMYCDHYCIDTLFSPIPGTPYSYAYVPRTSVYNSREAHRIENRLGGTFWAIGDAEKECEHALYSYPHLQVGKNYLEVNGVPADSLPADSIWCMYDPIQFHGWVERPADSIIWDFGDGNVERYRYEDGQLVTHTYADTGRFEVTRIIQYMDEALDTNWGYVACKSIFTRPSDTMYAHIWIHNHYDSSFAVTVCEGPFTFRGHVLETTDTHYVTTYWTASGCDTLWQIDLVTCPHCSFRADTISDEQLPWVFNGISFSHEVRHYPIHIDIGEDCDSIIDYYLIVIPHWGEPPLDTIFILAPNVITPGSDIESNRRFRLFCSKDIEVAEVYIFDRTGRRLAHFDGLTEEWDGTHNGVPVPQGAYAYFVRYIDGSNRNWKTKAGTFTIVR